MEVIEIDRSNILMCGDRFGALQIYIQDELDKATQKKIKDAIDAKLTPQKTRYVIHLISKTFNELKVTCGMRIECTGRYGTLGGFVRRNSGQNIYALVSRHVVEHSTEVQVGEVNAKVITPHTDRIDIATAKIIDADKFQVETRFKDIHGRPRHCSLFQYSNDDVSQILKQFEIVFIRGGTTLVGLGEIVCFSVEHDGLPLLRIRNRADKPQEKFCQAGDSGAIVCSTNRDGIMYALAMVVGESISSKPQKEYMAYMLKDGLEELSRIHKCTYRLCEGSDET